MSEFKRLLPQILRALVIGLVGGLLFDAIDFPLAWMLGPMTTTLIAALARQVNDHSQNIGARRLHTIMERLFDELSFEASDMSGVTVTIDRAYVRSQLADIVQDEDLSRYIL